ncbi:MAG: helix-turn-helix transcriptional regulator [Clostridia bacterium]|nr:helix-turn-helix transcriptional regulator [Clostridia bacterium]
MRKYFKHKINNLLVINGIITVHYFEFSKNFKHDGESHDFWEIVYADKEDIICSADGKEILLKSGQMLFHKPNVWHTLASDGKHAPTVFIISFDCRSEAMRFFEDKVITLDKQSLKYVYAIIDEAKNSFDIPYSNPYAKKLEIHKNPSLGGVQLIKNFLEIMLIGIMRSLTEDKGEKVFITNNDNADKMVKDTIKLLKEHVEDKISIDDVCKKTSYSRAYLFKKFKQTTGSSVMEYYLNLKIERGKQLIRENDLSVKQIADILCFDTPNYFSKTFKKKTGLTPLQYKKRSFL